MVWRLKKIWYRIYQRCFKIAMYFLDWSSPKLFEGPDSILELPGFIKKEGLRKVLIVTDKILEELHLMDNLINELDRVGVDYVVYDNVKPNPDITNIESCKDAYIENECDSFIAFGGGSSIDCAKIAAARVVKPRQSVRSMRGQLRILRKLPPIFAVPTTAGTGSETTVAAVVIDPETREKNAINDTCLRPKYVVLDPKLTVGLPPNITSTTGMDALTHSIEAYIGQSNTKQTICDAEESVRLIFGNIEKAYNNGQDLDARINMLEGAFLGGRAFTRAYVGYVHAISHNISGLYNTPHGLANSVILPYVLEYYSDTIYPKLAKLADIVGIGQGLDTREKGKAFISEIRAMNKRMNIPDKLEEIQEKDLPILVSRALKEANPLYPVPKIMDRDDCEAVIRRLMPSNI